VLEDLPRGFVKILGSRLGIPPSFFGDHWEDLDGTITRWTLRHRNPHRRYMLKWRRLHRKIIVRKKGDGEDDTYLLPGEVLRNVSRTSLFGDSDGVTTSGEKLSFWSSESSSIGKFLFAVIAASAIAKEND
jgi:hypothetical protein